MRTVIVSFTLLLTAFASAQERSPIFEQARNAGLRPEVISRLDEGLVQTVDRKRLAGFAAVIARDGKIGYERVYGYRNVESQDPMTKDSICGLASMTKPVMAITAMTLWEEGKFKLDDPISDILPEWKDVKVKQGDKLVPAERPITPRMLMTHTSGTDANWTTWRSPKTNPYVMTSDQFSKTFAARSLLDQPGTKYRYGSFVILGRYIEVLEGKSLDVVMQERLFGPLKMKDTGFWLKNKDDLSRKAIRYDSVDGELLSRQAKLQERLLMKKPVRMDWLLSTLDDFYRFARMLANKGELDGTRVLEAETVELICQNHFKHLNVKLQPQDMTEQRKIGFSGWGLGGAVNGKGYYSWAGATGVTFWAHTADKTCGVLMTQGFARPKFEKVGFWATLRE